MSKTRKTANVLETTGETGRYKKEKIQAINTSDDDDEDFDDNQNGGDSSDDFNDDSDDDSLNNRKKGFDGNNADDITGKKRGSSSRKNTEDSAKTRNREHAKNTRMRKKNYIQALKESIRVLIEEREKKDEARKSELRKYAEKVSIQKKMLQALFYFRSVDEKNAERWRSVVDDSFTMVMPITPYRSFPPAEVVDGQRHIKGVDGLMLDSASFNCMLQCIAPPQSAENKVNI